MDLKIEGNRAKTVGQYDPRMIRALNRLEGTKRWGLNRSFSFEATPYNLEIWRSIFPTHEVASPIALDGPAVVQGWLEASRVGRPSFEYKTPPRDHQNHALEKLRGLSHCGLFMDVGTGKSWTAIAMMGQRWCAGLSDYVLLIAKNGVHIQWVEEQIPEHMSSVVPWKAWVFGKTKTAEREFEQLLAFEGLKIFAINIDALITKLGEERIMEFLRAAQGSATMIVDESQDIKNIAASRTKAAIKYGSLCKYRMIMTGTPIAKNVVDLFSQFKFLDERIMGHRYLTTFRNQYCEMRQTDWGHQIVGHKNLDELYNKIDPYIFRITSEEALDLPPKMYIERPFVLSDEQLKLMKELKQNFFVQFAKDEQSFVKNAAGLLTRLQQISCGYLPMDDGSVKRLPNPRFDQLISIVEQRTGKIIIWCRFNHDIEELEKHFGRECVSYYGKSSRFARQAAIKEFMDADSPVRYFIASPEAAGTGLNLQGLCHTNIYYSNSFNALARWQSEGRTWRDGTKDSVAYFDLVAAKSPDRKILSNLKEKKSVSDMTLDDFRKVLNFD